MNIDPADFPVVENAAEVPSPALCVWPDRIEENVGRMIATAGGPERLRPHIKTCKMPHVVALLRDRGVTRLKCATIAEAEMCAEAGARDVLLACQPVGPAVSRWVRLHGRYPAMTWSTVADHPDIVRALGEAARAAGLTLEVLIDLNVGQNRTGIGPGKGAMALYETIHKTPGLRAGGAHIYDGHVHASNPAERASQCEEAYAPAARWMEEAVALGLPMPRRVAGGTPTFSMHARRPGVECSPGTCVLWDAGYAMKLGDLAYRHAAWLLARVLSKPAPGHLCLDLGHKAVASENPHPRVIFPELPDAEAVGHSEEHLVVKTARADRWPLGAPLWGVPWHVCPTVALYAEAHAIRNRRAQELWPVSARARRLTL